MGQVLHGSATTTEAVRRAIQHSQESVRALAGRHGVNPKTVSKWKHRETEADRKTGPKQPSSTVLTPEEEAVVVAFRRYTLLPLDDCLYGLQPAIPQLTRSSLHRCFQRTLMFSSSDRYVNLNTYEQQQFSRCARIRTGGHRCGYVRTMADRPRGRRLLPVKGVASNPQDRAQMGAAGT